MSQDHSVSIPVGSGARMVSIRAIHEVYNQTVVFVCEVLLAYPHWSDEQIIAYATSESREQRSAFQEMHLRDAISLVRSLADLEKRKELFQQE
jgi:hypothetical protein